MLSFYRTFVLYIKTNGLMSFTVQILKSGYILEKLLDLSVETPLWKIRPSPIKRGVDPATVFKSEFYILYAILSMDIYHYHYSFFMIFSKFFWYTQQNCYSSSQWFTY